MLLDDCLVYAAAAAAMGAVAAAVEAVAAAVAAVAAATVAAGVAEAASVRRRRPRGKTPEGGQITLCTCGKDSLVSKY
jgi:hypothetical protein